jgi:hypothetical protein
MSFLYAITVPHKLDGVKMFLGYNSRIMRKYLVIFLFIGLTHCEISTAQNPHGDSGAYSTQSDKRGTPDAPLVVNAHAIKSDAEAAEEKRENAEHEATDRWIIRLTLAIVVCAGLQFFGILGQIYVYRQQTRLMLAGLRVGHQNAQAALIGAKAAQGNAAAAQRNIDVFISKERAVLRATPYFEGSEVFGKDRTSYVNLAVRNIGQSNARDVRCFVSIVATQGGQHEAPGKWQRIKLKSIIKEDEDDPEKALIYFADAHDIEGLSPELSYNPKDFLIDLRGVLQYQDVFRIERESWFRYSYRSREIRINKPRVANIAMTWEGIDGVWCKVGEEENKET